MSEVPVEELQRAVEKLHQCRAVPRGVVHVVERFNGQIAWDGAVHLFDLVGHPKATVCFAWSSPIENTERRKFYAVLKLPPVEHPADAVRASIISDHRASKADA